MTYLSSTFPHCNNLERTAAGNATLYGYAGEVVLICLTVLFLLMFVVTAVKYHRLKTRCAAE